MDLLFSLTLSQALTDTQADAFAEVLGDNPPVGGDLTFLVLDGPDGGTVVSGTLVTDLDNLPLLGVDLQLASALAAALFAAGADLTKGTAWALWQEAEDG